MRNRNEIVNPCINPWSTNSMAFFYQNIDYSVQVNNLRLTKINENNMIKMSQTVNITLQPMQ